MHMFTLIIGISTYSPTSNLNPLDGVKQDLSSMEELFSKSKVFVRLKDHQATASAIRDELKKICRNDSINKNDPILIYFAGHGTKVDLESRAEHVTTMRMLCPYDFVRQAHGVPSRNGIPEAMLASILNDISSEKGNNVVCILN